MLVQRGAHHQRLPRGAGPARLPDYEVIVVDDGSRDATAAIARQYDCRLIRTTNRGLAHARNAGLAAASGEIVAYIDDEPTRPALAQVFGGHVHEHVARRVGGPNVAPPGDGPIAECVAQSPGGPMHVLLSDPRG